MIFQISYIVEKLLLIYLSRCYLAKGQTVSKSEFNFIPVDLEEITLFGSGDYKNSDSFGRGWLNCWKFDMNRFWTKFITVIILLI